MKKKKNLEENIFERTGTFTDCCIIFTMFTDTITLLTVADRSVGTEIPMLSTKLHVFATRGQE